MDSAEENLGLSFEFTRYLFKHPDVWEMFPKDVHVAFLPEKDMIISLGNLSKNSQRVSDKGTAYCLCQNKKIGSTWNV